MKNLAASVAMVALLLLGMAGPADARVSIGIGIPIPLFWPFGGWAPAYPAPPVIVQQPAPAYVAPTAPAYWYYCENPAGYYPYVPACPRGWLRVVPQPAPPPR